MLARPRRLRRVIKWTALACCFLLGATWLLSRWYSAGASVEDDASGTKVALIQGTIYIARYLAPDVAHGRSHFYSQFRGPNAWDSFASEWIWLPHIDNRYGAYGSLANAHCMGLIIPLWLPLLLLAAPTAFLFRRDRRAAKHARTNSCPHCSYPLSGLPPNSPCPECGKQATA